MLKSLAAGCIALCMFGANAAPISFNSVQYDTVAVASAGGNADFKADSSPATALPLTTSATVFDTTEFASAAGIAASGLLTTQAEASSLSGFASAVGTSEFKGSVTAGTGLMLSVDLSDLNFSDVSTFSRGTLFLLVTVNGATTLDQQLTAGGLYTYSLGPSTGGSYVFDLLLSSEANTSTGGNASNYASVTFDVSPVPEPGTWLLLATGLIVCVWLQRRNASR